MYRDIRFEFIPQGARVDVQDDEFVCDFFSQGEKITHRWNRNSTVVCDTGNRLEPGVIDHHQPGVEALCVASMIAIDHEKYLSNLDETQQLTIVTHFIPDLDAAMSSWLVANLVQGNKITPGHQLLADFTLDVDSGKYRFDHQYPVSIASLMNSIVHKVMGEKELDFNQKNRQILLESFRLFDSVLPQMKGGLNPWSHQLLDSVEGFDDYKELILHDYNVYLDDYSRSKTDQFELPNRETHTLDLVDFIVTKDPESFLWKYWVRGDKKNALGGEGFVFTCALRDVENNNRAIIATDPTTPYNLKGLGLLLDSMEIEKLLLEKPDLPLADNPRAGFYRDDPWYDGGSSFHNYTIIGAPRSGSQLSDEEILQAIGATDLWIDLGDGKYEDAKASLERVREIPKPISLNKQVTDVIQDYLAAGLKQKEEMFGSLKNACIQLHRASAKSAYEKQQIKRLREEIYDDAVVLYNEVPHTVRSIWVDRYSDLIGEVFPVEFVRKWLLAIDDIPFEDFEEVISKSLTYFPDHKKLPFLLSVQGRHKYAAREFAEKFKDSNDEEKAWISHLFYLTDIPYTTENHLLSCPLYVYPKAKNYVDDIAYSSLLVDKTSAPDKHFEFISLSKQINSDESTVSKLEEIEHRQELADYVVNQSILVDVFGPQFTDLRNQLAECKKSDMGAAENTIKRLSVTDVTRLHYNALTALVEKLNDFGIETIEMQKLMESLRFLEKIRLYEFTSDRMQVYLKMNYLLSSDDVVSTHLKQANKHFYRFLNFLKDFWQASLSHYDDSDSAVFHSDVKKSLNELEKLKVLTYSFPEIPRILEEIHLFMNRLLEELETPISDSVTLVDLCFKQLEFLTDNVRLFNSDEALPAYVGHVLKEIFASWKRYYQEKINFLQVEFIQVLESDRTQGKESRMYVDFCNKLLGKTIVYDWLTYKMSIVGSGDESQINEFYDKYFAWQRVTDGNFDEKTREEKDYITQLNSSVRFAVGKVKEADDITTLVKELPLTSEKSNFKETYHFLVWERDMFSEVNHLPLNQYYNTYDYLIDEYVEKFDINNVAESISAFSSKYPRYVQWFTKTSWLRKLVMAVIFLLFLMGAFDPNVYQFNGDGYRPPVPEFIQGVLGEQVFGVISGILQAFWTGFIGIAFLLPIVYAIVAVTRKVMGRDDKESTGKYGFLKMLNKIEGKSSKLLYVGFIIPLLLVVMQMAKPGTINMISHFEGLRLVSTIIIIFMLTVYSIYLDVKKRNPQKPESWVMSRVNHMFWLYSLQSVVITIFVIDFLLRFQLNIGMFDTPESLVTGGISRYIVLQFKWFDIVIMPLFTIIISFLTLFFSFFINRVFK